MTDLPPPPKHRLKILNWIPKIVIVVVCLFIAWCVIRTGQVALYE